MRPARASYPDDDHIDWSDTDDSIQGRDLLERPCHIGGDSEVRAVEDAWQEDEYDDQLPISARIGSSRIVLVN